MHSRLRVDRTAATSRPCPLAVPSARSIPLKGENKAGRIQSFGQLNMRILHETGSGRELPEIDLCINTSADAERAGRCPPPPAPCPPRSILRVSPSFTFPLSRFESATDSYRIVKPLFSHADKRNRRAPRSRDWSPRVASCDASASTIFTTVSFQGHNYSSESAESWERGKKNARTAGRPFPLATILWALIQGDP